MKLVSPERKVPSASRALLTILALAAFAPVLITALLILYVHARYRGRAAGVRESGIPSFQHTSGVKTMSEIMSFLKTVPFRASVPTVAATAAYGLMDSVSCLLGNLRATAGLIFPYPSVFEPLVVESHDGTPVCGLLALQPGNADCPALIVVHGLFSSKNSQVIQALSLRAFYDWGFHVLAMDLRNFGDSSRFSEAPTSWGYHESEDVLAVAEYLSNTHRVSTVGACGISMGAASVLLAASRCRLDGPLSGGVVALNGYSDAERMVERACTFSDRSLESVLRWFVFRFLLSLKTLAGGPRFFADLRAYAREISSQYYEASEKELFASGSPARTVGNIEVPCLVIHALDDFMVPVDEAYELLAAAVNNPMVDALIVPTGGHALYHMSSPSWFHKTLQAFFTYWAEFGPADSDWTGPPTDSMDTFGNSNN